MMDEDLSQIVCVPLAPALATQERLDAVRSACVYIAKYATKPLVKKKRERPLYTYNFSPPSTPRGNHTIAIDAKYSEGEASLVLPGEALVDGIEVLAGSPMPSLRYDSDDSDADINDLLLPAPLVGELEEDDQLQLPAPLVGVYDQATIVESQWRGPRHVHYLFDELPFGGLVTILMGDFSQIPCIPPPTLVCELRSEG
jgi:hypothetical protein